MTTLRAFVTLILVALWLCSNALAQTLTSGYPSLSAAITAVQSGGEVVIDSNQTLSSSLTISTPNLTLRCASPTVTLSYGSGIHIDINAQNVTLRDCNHIGPGIAITPAQTPFIRIGQSADASGFRFENNSFNGFGNTGSQGEVLIVQGSHIHIANNKSGDRAVGDTITVSGASWAAPLSGTMFGLETITATAALPSSFVAGYSVLCSGMSPTSWNAPGDGSSSYFGAIMSVNAGAHSFTVQQIWNPVAVPSGGAYSSGGTCTTGVGNADWDINLEYNTNGIPLTDLRVEDNDVAEVLLHVNNAVGSPNATVSNALISNNILHSGMNNRAGLNHANSCFEVGDFSGAANHKPQNMNSISEVGNTCHIVADGTAGCFSHSTVQNVVETGNLCYAHGHTYTVAADEQAGTDGCSISGQYYDIMGGGSGIDFNQTNHCNASGITVVNPKGNTSTSFAASDDVTGGATNASITASFNSFQDSTIILRSDICPATVVTDFNNCSQAGLTSVSCAISPCSVTMTLVRGPSPFRVGDNLWVTQVNGVPTWGVTSSFTKALQVQCTLGVSSCDHNKFSNNHILGGGGNATYVISVGVGSATSGDSNEFVNNDAGYFSTLFSQSAVATNTKLQWGLINHYTTALLFSGTLPNLTDTSTNPLPLRSQLTGTCSSATSTTVYFYGLGQNATTACTGTGVGTSNQWYLAPHAGQIAGLSVTATTGGKAAGSGNVRILVNSLAGTLQCTVGTGTSCTDLTHNVSFNAGDLISFEIAGNAGATETLAYPNMVAYVTLQDQ
jgi:hypothetical protein